MKGETVANFRKRWATKDEAKAYALKAESNKNTGLTYCAACDFLKWDVAARREALAEKERKSKQHASKRHSSLKEI